MTNMFRGALLPALLLVSGSAVAQEAAPAVEATPTTVATAPVTDAAPAAAADVATPAEPAPEGSAAPSASAPAATQAAGPISPPAEGMGQIVFFREKKFAGAAIRYKVREGDTELGKLASGTYFVVPVAPGAHQYTVHSEAKDILNLEVEAGETYYVIGSVTMGLFAGHPNLSPSDQATFEGMLPKLKSLAN
ncbi:MAG TPA: DUF2846 domain-containing protein [Luteimonas sp.]|nr:DUF2846 domain-containing protein [Luteimonas sp.]